MWIDVLLFLIAVLPLFVQDKLRFAHDDEFPAVIAGQPTIPPQVRL